MKRQFSKDGHVTTVTSPAQAVRLAFDGWQEVHPEPEPDTTSPLVQEPKEPTPVRKRTGNHS